MEIYRVTDSVFNDAVDRSAANIYLRKQTYGHKTFMFLGCSPKAGTTTISISAAVAMAESGWKTVLIDADFRKESDFKRLHSSNDNIASYITGASDDLTNIIKPTNHENLCYVPAGSAGKNPMRLICSAQMKEVVKFAKNTFDIVIIDAPSYGAAMDACILAPMMDDIILIVSWNVTLKKQLARVKAEMEASGVSINCVIINRMDTRTYTRHNNSATYFLEKKYIPESSKPLKPNIKNGIKTIELKIKNGIKTIELKIKNIKRRELKAKRDK